MSEFWNNIFFAKSDSLNSLEMITRGVIVFIVGVVIVRIGGKRIFGKNTAFDIVVGIIIGSILSRAITGNAPFIPTILTSFVFILLHRLFAWLGVHFSSIGRILKGEKVILMKNGNIVKSAMNSSNIGENDLEEALRKVCQTKDFKNIEEAYLERNGDISFIRTHN